MPEQNVKDGIELFYEAITPWYCHSTSLVQLRQ
jgi:hypothetical protein